MPSPFPGMDPYLESQKWAGFHTVFIAAIQQRLVPQVRPKYAVDVEEYVYIIKSDDEVKLVAPDVAVSESADWPQPTATSSSATMTAVQPVVRTLPKQKRVRQAYLVIRTVADEAVVATLEVLSPWNKTGAGHQEYLGKRDNVLASLSHLVEIDLLRGGQRLPTEEPLPTGDYFVFVSRQERRPEIDVYAWSLRSPLPTIPLPLAGGDPEVPLDLQSLFTEVYDRAGYDYTLDYRRPISPALRKDDAAWVSEIIAKR